MNIVNTLANFQFRKDNDLFIELSDTCEKDDGKVQASFINLYIRLVLGSEGLSARNCLATCHKHRSNSTVFAGCCGLSGVESIWNVGV